MQTHVFMFIVFAAAMLTSAAAVAQHDSAKGTATVKDVMVTMTIPASDAIFAAASEPPADDAQWLALARAGATLAESGRLLMRPALAKDNAAWMERAADMVNRAEAMLKIAKAKDGAALEEGGDKVYATCEACHAVYMEPGN